MNSRQRLQATLNHQQPDRVCLDIGATPVTGMAVTTLARFRRALLGDDTWRPRVIEPYQMLGEVDQAMREALGIDVVGLSPRGNLFGFVNRDWTPLTLFDGTEVQVSEEFRITVDDNGDWLIHPQGDLDAPPSGRMPKNGYFFDTIIRQPPLDEDNLDPADNCEEFGDLPDDEIQYLADRAAKLAGETEYGVIMWLPGCAIGDIALVPAPFLKHPKGIRDIEEWYVSTIARQDYVHDVFARQTEFAERNIARLADAVGDDVQVALVCGADFGTQRAPMISPQVYKDLYSPYYRRINGAVHEHTHWKTFKHCCGSIYELIPLMIDDGFDILNPVQCSAANMDARTLKTEFGDELVFWGGGVDTQKTLPFGTPDEVYREVRERIDILGDGGGFVFSTIHNIQANTPVANLQAMFQAVRDSNN